MDKFARFREDIPFLREVVYLDSAAVCPPSRRVIDAMREYYEKHPFNYGVGKAKIARDNEAMVNRARSSAAEFIGAHSPDEVVFTKNTTEALNAVANGLKWRADDQVIVSRADHQSNLIPWMRLRERVGITLTLLDVDDQGFVDPDDVGKALTKNAKLVTVTHGSNVTGAIQDVAAIGRVVKERSGALFMIDCAQTGGKVPIDVKRIGCDFAAFCGRKSLMGPQGTGFLYGKREVLRLLEPTIIGSRAAKTIDETKFEYLGIPFVHESGVLNTSGVIGLGAAVEQLSEIGVADIFERIQELSAELIEIVREAGLK
ncbi:MAG: aminotransferase class V-fold PLP-dependent enzyme, partial [Firmicutes bacterium]|nr:aminotransferase class V-fold PLP-dependent enzyme [Bacillota bacterium]